MAKNKGDLVVVIYNQTGSLFYRLYYYRRGKPRDVSGGAVFALPGK